MTFEWLCPLYYLAVNSNDHFSTYISIFPALSPGHEYNLSILRLYTFHVFERSLQIEGILQQFSSVNLCK